MHRNEFSLSEISASVSARPSDRLPRDASLWRSPRPFSDHFASESKNQHCDEKGVSNRKDFGLHDAFLPARERENQERSAWLDAADYADWRSCPAGPRGRGIPNVAAICE